MTTLTIRRYGEKAHHSVEAYPPPAPLLFRRIGVKAMSRVWSPTFSNLETAENSWATGPVATVCAHVRFMSFLKPDAGCHFVGFTQVTLATRHLSFGSFPSGPEALNPPLTLARLPGSTAQALP